MSVLQWKKLWTVVCVKCIYCVLIRVVGIVNNVYVK